MSNATIAWGRFNPPTEEGHGKLVSAVLAHAEEHGGKSYIFPTHTQDKKKNPLTHPQKVSALRSLFPDANVVSHDKVRTIIDAMKHLESMGHTHVTVVAGSDRVDQYSDMLNKYRKDEFPGIKKVSVISAGQRDPDAEGAEGMSASKLRGLVAAGKKDEFLSHYSDKGIGRTIFNQVKSGMELKESTNPVAIFLVGGPSSGKDYVLKSTFAKFDLMEVQIDHVLNGAAKELFESKKNVVINGPIDESKILSVETLLEGYTFDTIYVSVSNKVSRIRNEQRENPLNETKRIDKWLKTEKLVEKLEDVFVFNNSMNLNEASQFEKLIYEDQTQKLENRIIELGVKSVATPELRTFTVLHEKKFPPVRYDKESGIPQKYRGKLSAATAKARKAHWEKANQLSDRDPRAYEPAPGDKTSETKPSKHTIAVRKMMDEQHGVEPIKAARFSDIMTSDKMARKSRVRHRQLHHYNREMDRLSKPEPVTTHEGLEFDRPIPTAVDPTKRRVARSGNITAILAKRALSKRRMQAMSEGFDNYAEIARELVAKHGKNVTVKHVRDLEKERDSRKPIDAEEVMGYVKKITQIAEERNLKNLIDTTKNIIGSLSVPSQNVVVYENKTVYVQNNILWETVRHPSSNRWYLTGKYTENNNE